MARKWSVEEMLAENARRVELGRDVEKYDPVVGRGSVGERRCVIVKCLRKKRFLPTAMVGDAAYGKIKSVGDYEKLRMRYDFEYWATKCVKIRNKLTGRYVKFVLNKPQRRVLAMLEGDRMEGRPLRVIMLKARQWGGSTLIQMYMAWIQCVLKESWHSMICAHVKETAGAIRGMYESMLRSYPKEYWLGKEQPAFKCCGGMRNTSMIAGRDCKVTLASSYGQESVRGLDCAMAHLTEVAFWKKSNRMSPESFVSAVNGGIPMVPLSVLVLESTANGTGNFFHSEWLRAKTGNSLMRPVFVAWHEIEMYRMEVRDASALVGDMDDYEWELWSRGLTMEQICWYHYKRQEMSSLTAMKAEYPTDDVEAFANTGSGVFRVEAVDRLRQQCLEVQPERGDMTADELKGPGALRNVRFVKSADGELEVWHRPEAGSMSNRYIVAVDVGGRTLGADWSVIAVLDRMADPCPTIVAQWRGHCDHDLLGWRAAKIAQWYGRGLLVVESNSLESAMEGSSRYILEELNGCYSNLYSREVRDTLSPRIERRLGFHTNIATKVQAVNTLIAAVRDGGYRERSMAACDELDVYEQKQNGSFGAKAGRHDDMVMTRAIAMYVATELKSHGPTTAGYEIWRNRPRW